MFKWFFSKKKEMKKPKTIEENMAYMASLGVSPEKIMNYQKISETIKNAKGVNQ